MQTTSTELLKSYVFNEPIVFDTPHLSPLGTGGLFMVLWHLLYSVPPSNNNIYFILYVIIHDVVRGL